MKNTSFILAIAIFGLFTVLSTSCTKEQGCTDPDSVNYNPDAEEDDGSCEYEGKIVFWYDAATAAALTDDGAISLKYYVDGQLVGSWAADVYWPSSPNCGQDGAITVTKDLGNLKTQSYSYSVKDQDEIEYWRGTANFNANTCTAIELEESNWIEKK